MDGASLGDADYIITFLAKNVSSLIETGVLGQLPADCLCKVLSQDHLAIENEMDVLQIIRKWLSEQGHSVAQGLLPAQNSMKFPEDFFSTIRLNVMTNADLAALRDCPEVQSRTELLQRIRVEKLWRASNPARPPPSCRSNAVRIAANPVMRRVPYDLCFSVINAQDDETYDLTYYDHAGHRWCVAPQIVAAPSSLCMPVYVRV
jgi:hypothetical protein